ncbi:hypothetical protein RFI_16593 [Reticulomyxa filosa]|uniref:Uncharacterized protein n=1 Tax=Reticulomyxa filosa TaxID=46433 RepID=X6N4D7_RETFI|nr:hypothetical protein RFI_16593 [Reticulomyxa filosa]|eukprot:ETO20624.1 hypothetical protein RFI_16593 [Reticulomyxa filosa]
MELLGSEIMDPDVVNLCTAATIDNAPALFIFEDSISSKTSDALFQTLRQFPDIVRLRIKNYNKINDPERNLSKSYWSKWMKENKHSMYTKKRVLDINVYSRRQFGVSNEKQSENETVAEKKKWNLDASAIVSTYPYLFEQVLKAMTPCKTKFLLLVESPINAWKSTTFALKDVKSLENVENYLQEQVENNGVYNHFGTDSGNDAFAINLKRAYSWSLQNSVLLDDSVFLQHCHYARIVIALYTLRTHFQSFFVTPATVRHSRYNDMTINISHFFKIVQLEQLLKNWKEYNLLIMCWVKFDVWDWEQCRSLFSYFQSTPNHSTNDSVSPKPWRASPSEWIYTRMDPTSLSRILSFQQKMPFFDAYWDFFNDPKATPFNLPDLRSVHKSTNQNQMKTFRYCNDALYDLIELKPELVLGNFEEW